MKKRFGMLGCARWETENIVEWIDFHRTVGFEHFYIYCNDTDPAPMYRALSPYIVGDNNIVTFHHNPIQGNQSQSIKHFYRTHADEVEWIATFDIDEFICLKSWNTISEMIAHFSDRADAVYLNWLPFGPGEHVTRPTGDVLLTYTQCESQISLLTKHITRTSAIDYNILRLIKDNMNHYWFPPFDIPSVNVIGDDMNVYWGNFLEGTREAYFAEDPTRKRRIRDTAVLNHYVLRSRSDVERRIRRGTGGGMADQTHWSNLERDGKIDSYISELNADCDDTLFHRWRKIITPPASSIFEYDLDFARS